MALTAGSPAATPLFRFADVPAPAAFGRQENEIINQKVELVGFGLTTTNLFLIAGGKTETAARAIPGLAFEAGLFESLRATKALAATEGAELEVFLSQLGRSAGGVIKFSQDDMSPRNKKRAAPLFKKLDDLVKVTIPTAAANIRGAMPAFLKNPAKFARALAEEKKKIRRASRDVSEIIGAIQNLRDKRSRRKR